MAILRAIAAGQHSGIGLQDVATATGLSRPTVHRMLKAMIEEGMVEQHPRSRRYAIGEQVPMLALARRKRPALLNAAERFIEQIAREIGDTAFLTVPTGDDTLCLVRRMGGYPIQVLVIDVGARRPLGVSSAGIAMLSRLDPAEADAIIARNTPRFSAYRVPPKTVLARVAEARGARSFCSDPGLVPGTKAMSLPILDALGAPIGAISVAAVRQRLRPQRVEELADILGGYSKQISHLVASGQEN